MTTWLQCHECNEMFEVSNAVAEAMHHWRAESGDPFLCVDCATHIAWGNAISAMDGECTETGILSLRCKLKKTDRRGGP